MGVRQEPARSDGRQPGVQHRTPGLTMPQAVVISVVLAVVFVPAVVLSLRGMPMGDVFRLLGGAGGIGAALIIAVMPGSRGVLAAAVRAALQAGR
ncbi:hypothetical protein [Streptomyces sp. NBC_01006]|uniref:hypothetical protein n=1 Tax=Streptomyces sp. NBC_01006 TaxID=2903716 RepID=UPI003865A28D|nr:hypothetical protein OG509_42135 [Streptomyces sp. NBC_01006]WSW02891.1 hypothetical protein OG509_42690 [Streptomyces sp. NBC_01006]